MILVLALRILRLRYELKCKQLNCNCDTVSSPVRGMLLVELWRKGVSFADTEFNLYAPV